jgi:ATP-dependent DNA helicase RecG
MPTAPPVTLDSPVTLVPGVGPERAAQLARLDIRTIGDLFLHRPRRYEDRRAFAAISDLQLGVPATVRGKVVAAGVKRWKKGARALFECVLDDGTARLHCRWWQMQPWMEDHYAVGREFLVFGALESLRPRTMDHPETEAIEGGEDEAIHVGRIVPVHPLTEGLTARVMRGLVWRALERFEGLIAEPHPELKLTLASAESPGRLLSPSLSSIRNGGEGARRAGEEASLKIGHRAGELLPTRANAVRMLHFPNDALDAEIARQRLALDEFIELQLAIQRRRRNLVANAKGLPCAGNNALIKPFLARLGFKLTAAQTRVLRELRADLGGAQPMRRLLQGDVGSGKTAVAACAALMTIESGFSVALMAPTEILAEQHFRSFHRWFEPLGVMVELRTGSRKVGDGRSEMEDRRSRMVAADARSRSPISDLRSPGPRLTIGTHALLTEGFEIPKLGLVIIDEQHKFGVAQRERLVRKGGYPHLLVMTATPIPRTLGLTVYGDLDLSVIDELPAGRGVVKTFVRATTALPKVWEFVRGKLREGRQAYVVYARIDESSDDPSVKAITQEGERVRAALAPFQVGLLHGRMPAEEKERVLATFAAKQLHALVATTVIEVGIDVANATVMVIENAEMFGLSQLHQLRGRIGRGAHESHCILVASKQTESAAKRLGVMARTSDGFQIAEEDLKLRGPGDLLGQAQSGLPPLRFGNLAEDGHLVERARRLVSTL